MRKSRIFYLLVACVLKSMHDSIYVLVDEKLENAEKVRNPLAHQMVVAFSTSLAHKHARPNLRTVQNGLMCIDVTETSDEPKTLLASSHNLLFIFFQQQSHFKNNPS
jgi:hypothetical protein